MKKIAVVIFLSLILCFGFGCAGAISTQVDTPVIPTYNIYYELDGGTNSPNNESNYIKGQEKNLYNPTKSGYVFEGWYMNGKKVSKIEKGTTGDVTLVAHWKSIYEDNDVEIIEEPSGCLNSIVGSFGLASCTLLLASAFVVKRKKK